MVIYEPDPPMGNPGKQKTILDYPELIEFYKNIPTNVLQVMKLKIENELIERKLKENDR